MLAKILTFSFCLMAVYSILIESPSDEEDVCEFEDRRLAESVRFVRSKYSCRVYHVCAFYKQYTLTCAEGLFFDEDSDSCNYQENVYCSLPEEEIMDQENSSTIYFNFERINETTLEDMNVTLQLNTTTPLIETTTTSFIQETMPETSKIITTAANLAEAQTSPINSVVDMSSWWLGPIDCIEGFDHKILHQENCGLFYQCTKEGKKIEKACPYPLQYDEMLNECRFYDLIDCGSRKQAKDLCDYQLSDPQPSTIPCDKYPSCKNLSDGLYPTNDCLHYFQCKDERTLRIYSCPKDKKTGSQLKFNFLTKRCDVIDNVSFNCGGYTIPIDIYTNKMICPMKQQLKSNEQPSMETHDLFYAHPSECHLYITCDTQGSFYMLECYNGTHFSPHYQSCVHPSVANCKKHHTMDETQMSFSLKSLLVDSQVKSGYLKEFTNASEITTDLRENNQTEILNVTNSSLF